MHHDAVSLQTVAPAEPTALQRLGARRRLMNALNSDLPTAFTDIDFDASGRQVGYFYVPHSTDDDAWGAIRVPLAVLSNGAGPTVVLEAGNHGDEYEGQIVLGELIRTLNVAHLKGRLIFIPAINAPAVDAGKRNSPVDGANLNRAFPGDHCGSITEQIAAFVSDEIIARGDALISLHSGGSSLDIAPCTLVQPSSDDAHTERNLNACLAFGAPITVMLNLGDTRQCVASAVAAGLTCVSTEMAGTGTVGRVALQTCRQGVLNVLRYWNVLDVDEPGPVVQSTPLYKVLGPRAYVRSGEDGVFEHLHVVGDFVEEGQLAGRIHYLLYPDRKPSEVFYQTSGLVFARRHPGRVRPGNVLCVIATPC